MSQELLLRRHQAANSRYEQLPPERIGCLWWTVCRAAWRDSSCHWSK